MTQLGQFKLWRCSSYFDTPPVAWTLDSLCLASQKNLSVF